MSGNPFNLLSISIAEFDKLSGNSLTHTYPTDVHLEKYYPTSNIADKCIPDGAHIYHEDQTGIILPITEDNTELIQVIQKYISSFKLFTPPPTSPKTISLIVPLSPSSSSSSSASSLSTPNIETYPMQQQNSQQYLYGSVFFRNKLDDRVRRGAIQKSILVVTTKPLFTVFIPLMRDAIDRIISIEEAHIEKSDKEVREVCRDQVTMVLKDLYTSLKESIDVASMNATRKLSISFSDKIYNLKVPKCKEESFNGASLIDLLTIFEKHICYIWEALLFSRRIVFVGSPAKVVTMCCLSCPLLISPLKGITNRISPYVTIGDQKLGEHVYVCGMTNPLLENSKYGWDYYASIAAGKVQYKRQKISLISKSDFKDFIKQILSGIKKGKKENWVREQFTQFNLNFLKHVPNSKKKSITQNFIHSHVYKRFCTTTLFSNSPPSPIADSSLIGGVRFTKYEGSENSSSPLRLFPPLLTKNKHSQSYSGELRLSPKKPTSIKSIYRKLNPFISSKNESQFSQKDLISQVISDGELEFLWPYLMPNSESMLDWTVTGHVTLYKMTLCIKDGLNTFYSRHSGPLSHKYEKVLSNIPFIIGKLFKEHEEVIYSQEHLAYLDRKSLEEKEKALNEQTTKNKRDSSFLHIKLQKPFEQEYMVINSEVKQTSLRSLFVHKVVHLQLDSNKQYTFLENPEYFVYVVNRVSEEQTELTQVHVIRATNLSEKREKYTYFNSALETRKLLIERLDKDATDYSNIVVSDSDSSEDEDSLGSSE